MIIYIPIWECVPSKSLNPYVQTLTNAMKTIDPSLVFVYDATFFLQDSCEKCSIVHFMWPHLFTAVVSSDLFEERIMYLKRRGVKIICTCHNITPHSGDCNEAKYYEIAYRNCDVIIHLGEYSCSLFRERYPKTNNIVIPHHIYDDRYKETLSREDGLKYLRLPKKWRDYILCLGAFRSHEEAQLVRDLSRKLIGKRIAILAPGLFFKPKLSKNCSNWLFCLKWFAHKYFYPNVVIAGRIISEEELPYFFAVSSAVLIQRVKILNSGNVPLAFYMGKPVAGPDVGNVGELLRSTGNHIFAPSDSNSVYAATMDALLDTSLGKRNKEYATLNLGSMTIAKKIIEVYTTLLMNSR